MMTAFFDTSVLICAKGSGAKGDAARRVLADGRIISVEVLNESAKVLKRKFRLEWNIVAAAAQMRANCSTRFDLWTSKRMTSPWNWPRPTDSASTIR